MSDGHTTSSNAEPRDDLTAEQRADSAVDLKVTLLVFVTLVLIAVVTISGWSPQI